MTHLTIHPLDHGFTYTEVFDERLDQTTITVYPPMLKHMTAVQGRTPRPDLLDHVIARSVHELVEMQYRLVKEVWAR